MADPKSPHPTTGCAHVPRQQQPHSPPGTLLPCAVRDCPEGTDVERLSVGVVDPSLPEQANAPPWGKVRVFNYARLETPGKSVWQAVQ